MSENQKEKYYHEPYFWGFIYWPNQLLSAMLAMGSLAASQERLFDQDTPMLLKVLIVTLIITSFLYFGYLQSIKASVERGTLQSKTYKLFEPLGYLLVITALLSWAFLLNEAAYIGSDLIIATIIFCSLFLIHGFFMFKLTQVRKGIPLAESLQQNKI